MDTKVFKTTIRRNIAVSEAQTLAQDLFEYKNKSTAAADYMAWVEEYLGGAN